MPVDTVVDSSPIEVKYVAGDKNKPISDQAPVAMEQLESSFTSLRGERFYGVVVDGEYRACVGVRPDNENEALNLPSFTVPGGRYVHRKLADWDNDVGLIGRSVNELISRPDYDANRPVIEFYRSHTELVIRVPVH